MGSYVLKMFKFFSVFKAIKLSPNDALLYKLRADCRGKLERKEEAIEDYKLSIDIKFREEMRRKYLKR